MAGFGSYEPPSPPFDFAFESTIDDGALVARPETPSTPSSKTSSDGHYADSCESNCAADVGYGKKIPRPLRIQRTLAEKQRRFKLNTCIGKLASMVPFVRMSGKKTNKTDVLRLAASYLRLHHGLLKGMNTESCLPSFLTNKGLGKMLLESIDGFMIIINEAAKVVFVSQGIEKILGHSVVDVLGHSIYPFIHPEDNDIFDTNVINNLTAWDCQAEFGGQVGLPNDVSAQNSSGIEFHCGMLENSVNTRNVTQPCYKLVHIVGHLKLVSNSCLVENDSGSQAKFEKIFIGIVKLPHAHPYNQLSVNTNTNEISCRSSLDGRFLFVDQRLSVVLGYMPSEVLGCSGYEMIYTDDIPMCAEGCFMGLPLRLVTRTKDVLYFMACAKLVRNTDNGKMDTVFSVCTMISSKEGEKALAMAKQRFTPYMGSTDYMNLCNQLFQKSNSRNATLAVVKELLCNTSQSAPGTPLKRRRGRPHKYPLAATGQVLPVLKKSSADSPDGLPSVQQIMENFARAYAKNLNIQIPVSNCTPQDRIVDWTPEYPVYPDLPPPMDQYHTLTELVH